MCDFGEQAQKMFEYRNANTIVKEAIIENLGSRMAMKDR